MACYALGFQEIDQTQPAVVGRKGAHLGELSRIERHPCAGRLLRDDGRLPADHGGSAVDRRSARSAVAPEPGDREAIRALSAEIRRALEGVAIPDDLAAAITRPLARLGEHAAYAVRSSATAEDSPTASFAGQQDTYLNVVGPAGLCERRRRSWKRSPHGAGMRLRPAQAAGSPGGGLAPWLHLETE